MKQSLKPATPSPALHDSARPDRARAVQAQWAEAQALAVALPFNTSKAQEIGRGCVG